MKARSHTEILKDNIHLLKSKQAYEFAYLRKQFDETTEQLKPRNLISKAFKSAVAVPTTQNALVKGAIGLATGFITKRFLFGASVSPVKRMIGSLLQLGVSGLVYKNTSARKFTAYGSAVLSSLLKKKDKIQSDPLPSANNLP